MRIITGILFLINIALWIGANIVCWSHTGATLGVATLIGIIVFMTAWAISGEATLAPMDYLMQPEWDIFVVKLKWANQAGIYSTLVFTLLCLIFNWFDFRDFFAR